MIALDELPTARTAGTQLLRTPPLPKKAASSPRGLEIVVKVCQCREPAVVVRLGGGQETSGGTYGA